MFGMELDHVQIVAPIGCEAAARDFFGRILGLQELEKPESLRARGGCWFQVGSRQLHIGVETDFRPSLKAHPAFAVEEVEGVFARLAEEGVPCLWDETVPGLRRFYASDPWGNRLELVAEKPA